MNQCVRVLLGAVVAVGAAASAQAECFAFERGVQFPSEAPGDAAKVAVLSGATTVLPLPGVVVPGQFWTVTKEAEKSLATALAKAVADPGDKPGRADWRLVFMTSADKPVKTPNPLPFYLAGTDPESAKTACEEAGKAGTLADAAKDQQPPAAAGNAQQACAEQARNKAGQPGPHHAWVLFNADGSVCSLPYPLRQRDTLHVGVVVQAREALKAVPTVNVTGCSLPSPAPQVFASGKISDATLTSSGPEKAAAANLPTRVVEVINSPFACASDAPSLVLSIDGKAAPAQALVLYPRYAATLHLGVLNSRLREPDFALRTVGGQITVADKEAQGRGPEYVATVVVQAIPRYFGAGGGLGYPGRDLIHDNEFQDKLGLAIAFGLTNPGKRLGLGLSYELVKGVNLMVVREWAKVSTLDGLKLGDTYAGTLADLPTRKGWQKATTVGFSFDLAYITAALGGKK